MWLGETRRALCVWHWTADQKDAAPRDDPGYAGRTASGMTWSSSASTTRTDGVTWLKIAADGDYWWLQQGIIPVQSYRSKSKSK